MLVVETFHRGMCLKGPVDSYNFLVCYDFIVSTHSYLVSVDINMTLHQRNRFSQNIKAGSNQVNIKDFVIANYAKNSLVEISSFLRAEINYYSSLRVRFDCTYCLTKAKRVARISTNLELGWKITVVNYI